MSFDKLSFDKLTLNFFLYPGGHHEAGWRHGPAERERLFDIRFYQDLARAAEAAKFDAIFFADAPAVAENIAHAARFRFEPITWFAALAAVTERIGFVATASTTYTQPYNLARQFAALDQLSGGRAGWNIVTTSHPDSAQNFGLPEHPPHASRYEIAREYVEVVTKLWDSWEDDAVVADAASGVFADPAKIHAIDHVGRHFRVKGPLNTPRSPQGRPVYVQAGSSEDGRDFAARFAEAIFTAHQTVESARDFYRDVKARARALGRPANAIRILPGISPFLGGTEAEAKALERDFNDLIQPAASLAQLERMIGVDLAGWDLDAPFPRDALPAGGEFGPNSRAQLVRGVVERERPTIRGLIERLAGARGHFVTAGAPEQVADLIEDWFRSGAADGFNVMPPWLPGGFDAFASEVVPILQRRGLFRTEYEGTTLRDHYGLPRPESGYAARRASA